MICVIYILQQLRASMVNVGIFFMTYVLLNENLFGVFSWANNIPLIIALAITPALVSKMKGMYKLNKYSYMLATVCRLMVAVAGYLGPLFCDSSFWASASPAAELLSLLSFEDSAPGEGSENTSGVADKSPISSSIS